MSIYGRFIGAETTEDLKNLISRLEAYIIGTILDYAVENDIDDSEKSFNANQTL